MTKPTYLTFEFLEKQAANFYFKLEERFEEQPELAHFWREMALEELRQLGSQQVPTIVIDKQVLTGFNADKLLELITRLL